MSKFTDFLNLFMWDSIEDSEEEFNIDKALNDNWKKIDTKVKTHVTSVNEEINNFKEETNQKIENIQALPTGGTKGQVLTKQSETNGDANWEDIEANEVFVGNEEEAPETAKIIVEDEDFEESAGLSKAEIFVGAEEPTTGEKVWFRKGKNHFNGELKAGTFLNGVPNTEMSTTRIRNTEYIGVKNNTDYTISAKYSKTLQINVMIYDEDKKFIKEVGWNNVPYTFTTTDTTKYIMFALRESSNANITTKDITEIQLEQGSKATSYEAYIEPQIFVRNSNGVYEKFAKNNIKEISFTKNDANAIFYESVYATENEVQICGDIRYSYTSGTNLKAFTIDSKYLPIINNEDNKLRYPISTDKGSNGYAEVNPSGEVYIHTNGVATAAIINIRYRYK
nr:MAG TPA: hypothetical protein [Caudoviricetes sp.]